MRRKLRYGLLLLCVSVVTVVAAGVWFIGTPAGVRWLFTLISERSTLAISADVVEGRAWGDIGLERLAIRWPEGFATAERMRIRWRPTSLVLMRISADEVTARQVHIQDSSPEKPVDLTWPTVSGIPSFLSGEVRSLRVEGIRYGKLAQSPVIVDGISSRVDWHSGTLSLRDFSLSMPSVSVRGNASAGFAWPSLKTNVTIEPVKPIGSMKKVLLKASLIRSGNPVSVGGPVSLIAHGANGSTELSGELSIERKSVALKKLRVSRAGSAGTATGEGRIAFAQEDAEIEGRLVIEGFDLSPEVSVGTALSGRISVRGSAKSYRGEVTLTNRGDAWRFARISGSFEGNGDGVRLVAKDGLFLKGSISGTLEAAWSKGMELRLGIKGRDLNPSVLSTDWAGSVNLDLDAQADLSRKKPEVIVKARLLDSRLHGRTLSGTLNGGLKDGDVRIEAFFLRGRGFDLHAKGALRQRLSFSTEVKNLSLLVPGAEGSLQAEGWTKLEDAGFTGSLSGKARNMVYEGVSIGELDMAATLSGVKGRPVSLHADIRSFRHKGMEIERLAFRARGTPESHSVSVESSGKNSVQFHATMEGEYGEKAWRGSILRLEGRDTVGPFVLDSPVRVRLSRTEMFVSPFLLKGVGKECVAASVQIGSTGKGFLNATLERFDMARMNVWFTDTSVSGALSGNVAVDLQGKSIIRANATLSAAGVLTRAGQTTPIKKGSLRFAWDKRGLESTLEVAFANDSYFRGKIGSSLPPVQGIPSSGRLNAEWKKMGLALFRSWFPDKLIISGESTGSLKALWRHNDLVSVSADVRASGLLSFGGRGVRVKESSLKMDWGDLGLRASLDMKATEGGEVHGTFFSPGKPHFDMPDRGELRVDVKDFDPAVFMSGLPGGVLLEGKISGHAEGRISPGKSLEFSGSMQLTKGSLTHHSDQGLVSAEIRSAGIRWTWQGDALQGDVSLSLAEYGSLAGRFTLPLPARVPLSLNASGPVKMELSAGMKENGLLTSLFPGLILESRGDLALALKVSGTWSAPVLAGSYRLEHAGGFFPSAGIKIENVLIEGHFKNREITAEVFEAQSGKGKVKGSASLLIDKGTIISYNGTLKGSNFRAIYLPELQAEIDPDITFKGAGRRLIVRGEVTVQNLLVADPKSSLSTEPSRDVVIVDREKEAAGKRALEPDVQVQIRFTDRFLVKSNGINAQLQGDIMVKVHDIGEVRARGTLKVVKGTYKNFGVDLKIERGVISFTGGRIENPSLDVRAQRSVNEIRAGVVVSGTLEDPIIKLFSEPAMPDTDVLAYIVLGRPLGVGNGEQTSLLMKVSGTLLSSGEASVIQDQLRRKLGLDVLDVESGDPSGSTATRSLLTVGKYLTPKLFLSYGQSLVDGSGLFKIRYSLSKRFEIESQSGVESGVDLIYKIELK